MKVQQVRFDQLEAARIQDREEARAERARIFAAHQLEREEQAAARQADLEAAQAVR